MTRFDHSVCSDLSRATTLEWLAPMPYCWRASPESVLENASTCHSIVYVTLRPDNGLATARATKLGSRIRRGLCSRCGNTRDQVR
jgi:hypothetical protein